MQPAGNRAFAPPPLVAAATLELASSATERVGWGFIALYTLAFMSTSLLFLAPLLVTLALKVNSLVGIQQAPTSLALVAGTGSLRWTYRAQGEVLAQPVVRGDTVYVASTDFNVYAIHD